MSEWWQIWENGFPDEDGSSKSGYQLAAEKTLFPRWWYVGTISANLEDIWEMSDNSRRRTNAYVRHQRNSTLKLRNSTMADTNVETVENSFEWMEDTGVRPPVVELGACEKSALATVSNHSLMRYRTCGTISRQRKILT